MKSMLDTLADKLAEVPALSNIAIHYFQRPESLSESDSSIVLIPLAPPQQETFGSDNFLQKRFSYQVNVESSDYYKTKRIAHEVEKVFLEAAFYQNTGGLDEYFEETKRYVDARTYRGSSSVYDIEY